MFKAIVDNISIVKMALNYNGEPKAIYNNIRNEAAKLCQLASNLEDIQAIRSFNKKGGFKEMDRDYEITPDLLLARDLQEKELLDAPVDDTNDEERDEDLVRAVELSKRQQQLDNALISQQEAEFQQEIERALKLSLMHENENVLFTEEERSRLEQAINNSLHQNGSQIGEIRTNSKSIKGKYVQEQIPMNNALENKIITNDQSNTSLEVHRVSMTREPSVTSGVIVADNLVKKTKGEEALHRAEQNIVPLNTNHKSNVKGNSNDPLLCTDQKIGKENVRNTSEKSHSGDDKVLISRSQDSASDIVNSISNGLHSEKEIVRSLSGKGKVSGEDMIGSSTSKELVSEEEMIGSPRSKKSVSGECKMESLKGIMSVSGGAGKKKGDKESQWSDNVQVEANVRGISGAHEEHVEDSKNCKTSGSKSNLKISRKIRPEQEFFQEALLSERQHQQRSMKEKTAMPVEGDITVKKNQEHKAKNIALLKDLNGMTELLSRKHQTLLSLQRKRDLASLKQYISNARDIYDLSVLIVDGWKPIAKRCSDKILAKNVVEALVKVEVLGRQLRAIINQQAISNDGDSSGSVLTCAFNVVESAIQTLKDCEAAKIRFRQDIDDVLLAPN
jgi:hypothetical protein